MVTLGVAFQTNEIGSYFMLSYFGICNIKILGRFECNLGNISFLEGWKRQNKETTHIDCFMKWPPNPEV